MNRRNFIQLGGATLASLIASDYVQAAGKKISVMQMPDAVSILSGEHYYPMQSSDRQTWIFRDKIVKLKAGIDAVTVLVQSPQTELEEVKLSWKIAAEKNAIVLGDAWERTYANISWQPADGNKKLPWYCVEHNDDNTICFGVKTGCSAFCYWRVANGNLELNLDTRNGGSGVQLGSRTLNAAQIVTTKNESNENAFATLRRFCTQMCHAPRRVNKPVYGINDWYFAYGNNSAELILQHTSLLAPLVTSSSNQPFSVIDDGWSDGFDYSKNNSKFPDMQKLTGKIKNLGMRPGLWTRPLLRKSGTSDALLMTKSKNNHNPKDGVVIDATIEENIQFVKELFIQYNDWGFEMIKHDYSTFDIFGRWGFNMNEDMTNAGWHFNDTSKTNAEIILHVYKSIREASGDMYIIGCNTVSHLSAGLFELYRIGDDTSGKEWKRTKEMGVNTMGFRMAQHKIFYEADGDCVGVTTAIPWAKNKQWMQLLAQSSAPLFISAQPEAVGAEQKAFIKQCFDDASKPQPVGEPLDWLTNPYPAKWKLDDNVVNFDWN